MGTDGFGIKTGESRFGGWQSHPSSPARPFDGAQALSGAEGERRDPAAPAAGYGRIGIRTRTLAGSLLSLLLLLPLLLPAAESTAPTWQPAQWNGESALAAASAGWKAIVSLGRGRLVFFGPDTPGGPNLLFATTSLDDPVGRGGHRVWLGPQNTWASGWPPPTAWERSGPEKFTTAAGTLRLLMPDAGDGWPRLTRTYRWDGAALVCGVEASGGTRRAQFIQIIQVPATAVVDVTAQPDAQAPQGYVLLPSMVTRRFTTDFPPPPQVQRKENQAVLRHVGIVAKLGFCPQPLVAREGDYVLTVRRAASTGQPMGEPDEGFSTQVYLGGQEPFIELEQLTALFSPAAPASFAIILDGAKH